MEDAAAVVNIVAVVNVVTVDRVISATKANISTTATNMMAAKLIMRDFANCLHIVQAYKVQANLYLFHSIDLIQIDLQSP